MRRISLALLVCMFCTFALGQAKTKKPLVNKPPAASQPAVNKQAVAILQQAASLIAQLPAPAKDHEYSRVQLLNDLGREQWRAGDLTGARKSFDEALSRAKLLELTYAPGAKQGGSEIVQSVAIARAEVGDAAGVQTLLPMFSDVTV